MPLIFGAGSPPGPRTLLSLGAVLVGAACSNTTAGLAEKCADVAATACFSSNDCPIASTRCTTPGNADRTIPLTCCLPGARGTGVAGTACKTQDDCASGLCVYGGEGPLCSQACQADADCPATLPRCVTIDAGVLYCGLPP